MDDTIEFESKSPDISKKVVNNKKNETDTARWKLLKRPSFSFRLQITLGFFLFFVLSMAIIIASMATINRIERKLRFVQVSERFLFEVEQARRWEKNYFLYGTNIDDADRSASKAKILLSQNLQDLRIVASPEQSETIVKHLNKYKERLHELVVLEQNGIKNVEKKQEIETALRKHGGKMVEVAASLALKEQESINSMLKLIQRIPIYCLFVLFLMTIYVIHFLAQRFMKPLNRLIDCTHKIATGDFSPIGPKRKYRDEFTTVEVAINRMLAYINRMLEELESHQAAMVESQKLKAIGTITSGVAHELNNPLNNIMLTAHLLLEDHKNLPEDELLEAINDLITEAERSRSIVHNLLDFARESEYMLYFKQESESVSEPFELGVLVDKTAKLAINQVMVSGAGIEIEVQPNLPQIRGDKQELQQMFLNLILNALDAVGKGGKIKISVEKDSTPGFLAVHVEDNGCGIPAEILPHIFDSFFTTKPPGKGTGLGLSVCQGIVTKHGGRIDVSSEVGRYTRFTVILPSTDIPADFKKAEGMRGTSPLGDARR